MSAHDVVAALIAALDQGGVLTGEDIDSRFAVDWSGQNAARPMAVVRPVSTAEVATVVRVCAAHRVGVVPQGGLTGLAGGATPGPSHVVVNLERMRSIEAIDAAAGTMTVEAGVTLQAAQEAAAEHGLEVAVDLASRGSCQIGGMISTNAGGNRVLRFGMMREQVLGLEAVLADGTVVSAMHGFIKNNTGYDVKQLFIGAEGTLGIVTRAVLRVHPVPGHRGVALVAVDSPEQFPALLASVRRLVPSLTAFEAMWPYHYDYVSVRQQHGAPLAPGCGCAYALVESSARSAGETDAALEALLTAGFDSGLLADGAIARSTADVAWFWSIREALVIDDLPRVVNFDVSLRVGDMADFAESCRGAVDGRWPGAHQFFYGHLGDGNLHISTSIGDAGDDDLHELDETVYGLVRRSGGSISAEHGIGTLKRDYLTYSRSPEELAVMKAIKAALDPHGIMNPGKVL